MRRETMDKIICCETLYEVIFFNADMGSFNPSDAINFDGDGNSLRALVTQDQLDALDLSVEDRVKPFYCDTPTNWGDGNSVVRVIPDAEENCFYVVSKI
jgi:hypothetical protein